jgi:hypothetical protein
MTDPQNIPEDIKRDAKNALQVAKNRRHPVASIVSDELIVQAIAEALLIERNRNAQPRMKIIEAICELPHSINDKKVEFRFDPRRPGHNALNQLMTQLEAQFGTSKEEA